MSVVSGLIFTRGNAKPLPRLRCCWAEGGMKKERERLPFFSFGVCLLYNKCYSLKATLHFIELFLQRYLLKSSSEQCVWGRGVVLEKTCSCGVKVMLRSRTLRREETEVLGKSSTPQATRPTSGAETQLRTDSCRHPVWMNSWPGCLGEKGGGRYTKMEEKEEGER